MPARTPTAATSPPRSGRAAALPPEQRRRAVVAATLPLVLAHGHDVTTRQIADAAGVAEGTIFRVFRDKDELLEAVVQAAFDPAPLEEGLAAIPSHLPWETRLTQAVQLVQDRAVGIWHLMSAIGPPRTRPPADRPLPGLDALAALLADGPPLRLAPHDAAARLRAFAIAGGHPALMGTRLVPAHEVVALFLHGALAPAPPRRSR